MIPLIMVTWKITGDEPHYLLAAHSLTADHDFDLKNNYLNGDHKKFYPLGFLDPHVKQQPNGAWLLSHDIGLPLVIAPAYALAGRLGVMHFFALVGAGLAAQMFLLGWEVSGQWWAGLLGWLSLFASAPLALYVFQIYPELIGSLLTLFALRYILCTPTWIHATSFSIVHCSPAPLRYGAVFVIVALSFLPWLSGRFIPLQFFLIGLLIWKHWAARKIWISASGLALASLAVYLGLNLYFFGGPTPSATPAGNAVAAGFSNVAGQQIGRGLAAWWFDQQRGLLVYGPILIVAFFGLPHLWNARKWDGVWLWAPVVLMWGLAAVWGGFYIGWEISARFLIVGLPMLAGSLAVAAARIRNIFFWPLAAGLLTLSILNTAIISLEPFYAYHESPIKFYEEATRWQIRAYLPALGTRTIQAPTDGASAWTTAVGEQKYLVQATEDNLSIGWYVIRGQAQLTGAVQPNAAALQFDIFSSESGIPLVHADVPVDPAQPVVDINIPFYNPYYDKWNFPLYVDVRTTGAAAVRLSYLLFEPDPAEIYPRVAAWVLGIALLTLVFADKKFVRGWLARLAHFNSRIKSG